MTFNSLILASLVSVVFSQNPLSILDQNNDGFIEQSEFPGGIQAEAWDGMVRVFDLDGDGRINLDEYTKGAQRAQPTGSASGDSNQAAELSGAFLDKNKNGIIEQDEIPGNLPPEAFQAMLSHADSNNDGQLSVDEYVAFAKAQAGGGASSITVATTLLSFTAAFYLFC